VLTLTDVRAGYGRAPVIHGVDLEARPGELLLVAGPNGAGKTTLLRTIAGFVKPQAGTIELDGKSIARKKPETLARSGLRLILEGHRVFPELTVEDNLELGKLSLADRSTFDRRLEAVLGIFPILAERKQQAARDLSGGQQQLLALAQAFVGGPRVLLCDEPSLGVAHRLVGPILDFLRELANDGVAVVVVEQAVEQALERADRVVVLRQGGVVAEGPPGEFDANRLRQLFLGV
jgi:branched-chain amino acid transport system ATP-binding protein